jgi:hypothetical protein
MININVDEIMLSIKYFTSVADGYPILAINLNNKTIK